MTHHLKIDFDSDVACPWLDHGSLRGIAHFALMTQGKNQHDILPPLVAIQRDIPTTAIGDQQLSQLLFAWPADQRMSLKNLNPVANYGDRRNCGLRCIPDEKVSQSLQVSKCMSRVNYFSHDRAFGRVARLPRMRASR